MSIINWEGGILIKQCIRILLLIIIFITAFTIKAQ